MKQAREELGKSEGPRERGRTNEQQPEVTSGQPSMLRLQRLVGNQAVLQLLESREQLQSRHRSNDSDGVNDRLAPGALAIERVAPLPSGAHIQRSCTSCSSGGPTCPKCEEEERLKFQRKTAGDKEHADSVSHNLLDQIGAGQPLDPDSRAFFEPRFGRDFSAVRIHTDEPASATARSINALAYTVGNHVVVQQDHFAPSTDAGRQLLGHELTHTIQQSSPGFQQKQLISDPADAAEQEAERIGAELTKPVRSHGLEVNTGLTGSSIQRKPDGEADEGPHDAGAPPPIAGVPTTEEDQQQCVVRRGGCPESRDGGKPTAEDIDRYNKECREELNYTGPDVQPTCATVDEKKTDPVPGGNMAHQKLSKADQDAIVAAGGTAPSGTGLTFSKDGPRFVLHDTATSFDDPKTKNIDEEAIHLARLKRQDNTPVGEGAASYVTSAGAPERTHTRFFDAQRPTASQFEKGNDLMDQFTRETTMQRIWSLTNAAEKTAAITNYLGLFPGLSKQDVTDETKKARQNLDSATPSNKAGATPVVKTTATGATAQICNAVAAKGADKVAVQGQEAALTAACLSMKPLTDARNTRIAETTNVEIIAEEGSDCRLGGTPKALSYLPAVYDSVAKLYVLAALEAGQFPEITTHYFLDSIHPAGSPSPVTKSQNRCDPRCFDLDLLYSKIAVILNHPAGTIYGITPNYGTTFGSSNVWWPQQVCGTAHGVPAPAKTTPAKKKQPAKLPDKKKSKPAK